MIGGGGRGTAQRGECQIQQVREGEYCSMAPIQLLPSITVAAHTYGTTQLLLPHHAAGVRLIAWHTPTNAWQVLLAIMNVLGAEVRK